MLRKQHHQDVQCVNVDPEGVRSDGGREIENLICSDRFLREPTVSWVSGFPLSFVYTDLTPISVPTPTYYLLSYMTGMTSIV